MKSKISLLVGIPAALSLALASLIPAAHAALPPGTPLFNVQAAVGYYQFVTPGTNPSEAFVVAVKDRANNPITNATVTFAASPAANVTFTSATAVYSNNGFYVLPNTNVTLAAGATTSTTLTATATVPGVGTIGTATFTIVPSALNTQPKANSYAISYVTPTGVGTAPGTQSAPVNTVYPFQDEVRVTDRAGNPVSGVQVTFTIANTGTTATSTTQNARFINGCSGQVCADAAGVTDAEGIAIAEPIQALTAGTFTVTASFSPGVVVSPQTTSLPFSYVVTAAAASACQLFIGAFTAGGTDSISLRTGDQGPHLSLSPTSGLIGPIINGDGGTNGTNVSGNFPGFGPTNAVLQNYPVISYLTLGTAGGSGVVRAIPLVPRYYRFVGGGVNPNSTTLNCTVAIGNTVATQNQVTVTATLQALVATSGRAGVRPGDILTVTVSKTAPISSFVGIIFGGGTQRGLNPIISEQITVQDTSGASPTTVFGGGSLSVAPQSFIISFDTFIF